MKRLEIPAGGMPFTGDDLLWMADGLLEGIIAVASNFLEASGTTRGILQGMDIFQTGNSITIAPGWCTLDGKICLFEGWTGSGVLGDYELYYAPVYDPAGSDVFADAVTRDTYRIDKAGIRATTAAADNLPDIIPVFLIPSLKINVRIDSSTQVFKSATKSKVILSRYGKMRNLNIIIGHDIGVTNPLATILATDRPVTDTIERWVPVLSVLGESKGYVIFDPATGLIRYFGELPAEASASYLVNLTWIV